MQHTECNEELGVVRVLRAIVGHGDKPSMRETQSGVDLILEGLYTIM